MVSTFICMPTSTNILLNSPSLETSEPTISIYVMYDCAFKHVFLH